ncbi:trypsin-like peptidase domain-containing protein [Streptomyces sp. NPDC012438]|uniref:effector-associated domain 2-containing protein n=1 Tax=Streptomyces sp. NPDC012438 TaxID=3364833 RepID=UPI0036E95DF1
MQLASVIWLSAGGSFLGSGFLTDSGTVVTAAHVVIEGASLTSDLVIHHVSGDHPVEARHVVAKPSASDGRLFYPYPDLAALHVPALKDQQALEIAHAEAGLASGLTALCYSMDTPEPGAQIETLALRAAGRSGPYVRLLGDGIRPGHSGAAVVNSEGLVCGVLKGSRSYANDQGGWSVPVAELERLLGRQGSEPVHVPAPKDAEIVDALMAFPAMARPDRRFDLLDKMGEHLGLPYSFEADDRPERRDHLYRIVHRCRHFTDSYAALTALYTAMEELVPYDGALDRLRDVIGRAVGGWETI